MRKVDEDFDEFCEVTYMEKARSKDIVIEVLVMMIASVKKIR